MPYQVTMDSNLSDEDLDRLQISNYNRRKWNTKFATESDSEYASEMKNFIRKIELAHPTGRWRVVRYVDPLKLVDGTSASMFPDEAVPEIDGLAPTFSHAVPL